MLRPAYFVASPRPNLPDLFNRLMAERAVMYWGPRPTADHRSKCPDNEFQSSARYCERLRNYDEAFCSDTCRIVIDEALELV